MSLKPIIKSAREALDRKDYEYALQLCTDALEFEPENYFLLVFRAVALINAPKSDFEAALLAYTKATRSQPDNPLAYQGIVNLYESKDLKADERYHKAIEDLCQLYSKQGEWDKHFELRKKQLSLFKQERRTEDAIKALDWLSGSEAAEHYKLTPAQSLEYAQHQVSLLEPFEATQITKEVDSNRTRLNAEPVAILRERAEVSAFQSTRLNEFYRRLGMSGKLAERLLKMVLSDYLTAEEYRPVLAAELLTLPEAEQIKATIKEECNLFVPGAPQAFLAEAQKDFANEQFEQVLKREAGFHESLRKWKRAFSGTTAAAFPTTQLEWIRLKFLATVRLGWFEDAYVLLASISREEQLSQLLFDSVLQVLEETRHLSESVTLIEEQLMQADQESPCLILRLIDTLIKLARFDEAAEYINAVKEAYDLDTDLSSQARLFFASGMVAWLQGRRTPEACLNEFLKALKADSSSGLYFFWVGKYYWRMERQSSASKALKCLTKALSLSPSILNAALSLAEIVLQEPELAVEGLSLVDLLQPFVSVHARNRRLMYYLGAAHYSLAQYIEAATAWQAALKAPAASPEDDDSDPPISDAHCLTFLAEAFLRSGRFASAEKAFLRLQHEAPGPVASAGLASVYSRSEHFIQAVDVFDAVSLTEVSGLVKEKLLIDKFESKLLLAKFYLSQARFRAAQGQLNDCLAIEPIEQSAFWRLKSELFLLFDEFKECLNCDNAAIECSVNPGLIELEQLARKQSILHQNALLCALHGLSLAASDDALLSVEWLQVAHCLLRIGSLDFASAAARNALKSSKSSAIAAQAHHLLFVVADRQGDSKRAQHHLVRALHLHESVEAWLDLGRFYSRQGDPDLAQESFKRALALDTDSNRAAIELAALDTDASSSASLLALAQRDFAFQPARFDVKSASIAASAQEDSETRQFARLLLHLRFPSNSSFPAPDCQLLDFSVAELWRLVNEQEPANVAAWWTLVQRDGFDCEYLRTRPLNDLAQAGWRGLTDPLASSSEKHRTQLEEQILNNLLSASNVE